MEWEYQIKSFRDGHGWIGYGWRVNIYRHGCRIFSALYVDYSKREAERLAHEQAGLTGKHMQRI